MNKLLASSVLFAVFAVFAVACASPTVAPGPSDRSSDDDDDTASSEGAASQGTPRTDASAPRATTTTTTASTTSDAGAATTTTSTTPGKGDGKGADADCMTACNALDQCDDKTFCDFFCSDEPEVITCLATAPSCSKQDIIACEGSTGADDKGGDDDGNVKGGGK